MQRFVPLRQRQRVVSSSIRQTLICSADRLGCATARNGRISRVARRSPRADQYSSTRDFMADLSRRIASGARRRRRARDGAPIALARELELSLLPNKPSSTRMTT